MLKWTNRNISNEWWLREQTIMNFWQYFQGMALKVPFLINLNFSTNSTLFKTQHIPLTLEINRISLIFSEQLKKINNLTTATMFNKVEGQKNDILT